MWFQSTLDQIYKTLTSFDSSKTTELSKYKRTDLVDSDLQYAKTISRIEKKPIKVLRKSKNIVEKKTVSIKANELTVYAQKQSFLLDCLSQTEAILQDISEFTEQNGLLFYPLKHLRVLGPDFKSQVYEQNDVFEKLDDESCKRLLVEKLVKVGVRLKKLRGRVADQTSKILVTGDINSGKSTLINALLGRHLLPVDQQPNTFSFCEVSGSNDDTVHVVHENGKVSCANVEDLETHMNDGPQLIRLGCREAFLGGDAVNIHLIDSPGLNRDSINTMALHAKQEDIDVVVFVVNACNHMTLSAQEFLGNVSKEKSYVFVVVNRFDDIKDQKRCRSKIMAQIEQILPKTFENSNELVHFVSASKALTAPTDSFVNLEKSLKGFLLAKRSQSKLSPAKTLAMNILVDIITLCSFNEDCTERRLLDIQEQVEWLIPEYDRLIKSHNDFVTSVDEQVESVSSLVEIKSTDVFNEYLENLETFIHDVPWHGILDTHFYAQEAVMYLNTIAMTRWEHCQLLVRQKVNESIGLLEQRIGKMGCKGNDIEMNSIEVSSIEMNNAITKSFSEFIPSETNDLQQIEFTLADTISSLVTIDSIWSFAGVFSSFLAIFNHSSRFLLLSRKTLLISSTIIGAAGVILLTRNIKQKVDSHICRKVRSYYKTTNAVNRQSRILYALATRSLRFSAWELDNQFVENINSQEKIIKKKEEERHELESSAAFMKSIRESSECLSENLGKLEL